MIRVAVLFQDEQSALWSGKALQQAAKQQADLEIALSISGNRHLCLLDQLLNLNLQLDFQDLLHVVILWTGEFREDCELQEMIEKLPWKLITPVQLDCPIELDDLRPVFLDRTCWFGRFNNCEGYGDYDPALHEAVCQYFAPLSACLEFSAKLELKMSFKMPSPLTILTISLSGAHQGPDLKELVEMGPQRMALFVRTAGTATLTLIHPVYAFWLDKACEPHKVHRCQAKAPLKRSKSTMDDSISLSGWSLSQASQPSLSQPSCVDSLSVNKNALKKLLLLSLRHVGIDKQHPEFTDIWKHLYCGCLFALRAQLHEPLLDQATMLSVIRNNMNFLNVKK